jgi:hypothetical protein
VAALKDDPCISIGETKRKKVEETGMFSTIAAECKSLAQSNSILQYFIVLWLVNDRNWNYYFLVKQPKLLTMQASGLLNYLN